MKSKYQYSQGAENGNCKFETHNEISLTAMKETMNRDIELWYDIIDDDRIMIYLMKDGVEINRLRLSDYNMV